MLSSRNYNIAGHVIASIVTISGVYFIYQLIFYSDISFSANWNMFNSILMWPLYIIGLIIMFANWNRFSFSYNTYEKTTYSDGRVEVKRDWDIIEWMMGHVLAPILGRFILVPLAVAALIYYPLMCIVHVVGAVFPYILSLIVLGIIGVSWMFTRWFKFQYSYIILIIAGIVFTTAFAWGGYAIGGPKEDSYYRSNNTEVIHDNTRTVDEFDTPDNKENTDDEFD